MTALRIIFAGTPEFGIPCLNALHASQHQLIALYTKPDSPAGRGQRLQESAVKIWGLEHHIPIYQPLNFKSPETIAALQLLAPDLMVVIAYGLILPKSVLMIPRLGCLNVHASLLPRWRGAAPIQHAILSGDQETGVSIMQMDTGMDTGPYFMQRTYAIQADDTAETLHDHLSILAKEPLLTTIDQLIENHAHAIPQCVENVTYAPKIHKADARLDWQQSAIEIDRKIRAYYPWPIAFTQTPTTTIRIHRAQLGAAQNTQAPGTILDLSYHGILVGTGMGTILVQLFQFPGGRPISAADYLNTSHRKLAIGMRFE